MRKTDIYNVITDRSLHAMKDKMLAMSDYLKSQGINVSSDAELYRLTKKTEELIEIMAQVGEINLKEV